MFWPTSSSGQRACLNLAYTLVVAGLGLPASGHALTTALSASVECDPGSGIVSGGGADIPSASCSPTNTGGGTDGYGITSTALAKATLNIKKVGLQGSALVGAGGNLPGGTWDAEGEASGYVADTFTITAEDAGGDLVAGGTLVINLQLSGGLATAVVDGGAATASAKLQYSIDLPGHEVFLGSFASTISSGADTNPITNSIEAEVEWEAGEPVPFSMAADMRVYTRVNAKGTAQADVAFINSLDWGGISSVKDTEGNPVASFTALTPDGVNMATPVPIPAMLPVFTAALALVGLRRRHA